MSNNKKISTHPSLVLASDLKEICAPLETLNIKYFAHVHVDKKGSFSSLGLQPEFAKLYMEKQYYNFDIHMAKMRLPEQYIIWDSIERKKESKELYNDFQDFALGHTFTLVRENEEGRDCFHFATKLGNGSINNNYLQNLDLLKKFINYFTDQINGHKELQSAYKIKFQVNQDCGGYFTKNDISQIDLEKFNQAINADRIYLDQKNYLTKREFECLYWLAQGKTLEEIAKILSVTPRTIKAHVANIKEKFKCYNQFQLGMLYQEFSKLNLG